MHSGDSCAPPGKIFYGTGAESKHRPYLILRPPWDISNSPKTLYHYHHACKSFTSLRKCHFLMLLYHTSLLAITGKGDNWGHSRIKTQGAIHVAILIISSPGSPSLSLSRNVSRVCKTLREGLDWAAADKDLRCEWPAAVTLPKGSMSSQIPWAMMSDKYEAILSFMAITGMLRMD